MLVLSRFALDCCFRILVKDRFAVIEGP
jgi:hypothetical protein